MTERNENILKNFVKITLPREDSFLLVKETLTRIGIASNKEKKLFQSCHILHKKGEYYIVHFKELFALDGKPSTMTQEDYARRNMIANLLSEWGLVNIVSPISLDVENSDIKSVRIVPFNQKHEWQLIPKYSIGNKRG